MIGPNDPTVPPPSEDDSLPTIKLPDAQASGEVPLDPLGPTVAHTMDKTLNEPSRHEATPDEQTQFGAPSGPAVDVALPDSKASFENAATMQQSGSSVALDALSDVDPNAPTLKPGEARPTAGKLPSSGLRSGGSSGLRSTKLSASGEEPTAGKVYAGKYELLNEIARGGMGVVYKARQIDLNRIVALKVMLSGSMAGEEDRRRFILEAEASARLKHPNIVPVFDIGEVGGNLYFTMDYVEGQPLSSRKRDLDREQLLKVMIQVADGVAFAHQRGIIHRDLKPANIMMDAEDVPLIMDFGLAKQVELAEDESGQPSLRTREGSVMGTPHYMPPEQAEGKVNEIDVRSDVYALGVILYELWTGELPFTARSITELLYKIYETDPRPPRQVDPTVDWDMEAIILKALEKPKDKRYQTAAELKLDLEHIRDGLPVTARRATVLYRLGKWSRRNRRGIFAASLIGALLAVTGGLLVRQTRQARDIAQQQYRLLCETTEGAGEALRGELARLSRELKAFDALGEVAARRRALPRHRADMAALCKQVTEARARLQPYLNREEASQLEVEVLAPLGKVADDHDARLARLADVHAQLALAARSIAQASEEANTAVLALAKTDLKGGSAAEWSSLDEALTAQGTTVAATAGGGGQAERQRFEASLALARRELFTAIGLSGKEPWPEVAQAQDGIAKLGALKARVDSAGDQANRVRLAAAFLAKAKRLLQLLEESGAAGARTSDTELLTRRLRAARLAQTLLGKGREARDDHPGLESATLAANRAYAQALLDMQAYQVLDAELANRSAFAPADHEALTKAKLEAQAAGKALDEELQGMARKLASSPDAQTLRTLVARLGALAKDEAIDVQLEAVRRDLLGRAQSSLDALEREEALREIARATAEARASAAGSNPVDTLDERLAAWEEIRRLIDARAQLLGETVSEATRRTCALEQAKLTHDAALALERRDPPRALELAEAAAQRYAGLPADDADAASKRELVANLVRRLRRVRGKPEGMVLIPGRADVELGSGAGDRNPLRRVRIEPFYLSQREVSCAEYALFLASAEYSSSDFWDRLGAELASIAPWPLGWTNKQPPADQAELPVTGISWDEARGYAQFMGMRLPRDDEWEYAARYQGADVLRFPWGDEWRPGLLDSALRSPESNSKDQTPSGVFDMGGNVSEWTVALERLEGGGGRLRPSARGASFLYPTERIARGTHRLVPRADYRGPQLGLRLAKGSE